VWAALRDVDSPERSLRDPLIAGLTTGAAAMVVPTCGALAMIAAASSFIGSRGSTRLLLAYMFAGAVVPLGLLAFVTAQHTLLPAFYQVILFPASQYAGINAVPFAYLPSIVLQNYPLAFFFPIVAVLMFVAYLRGWPASLRCRRLSTCAAFGVAAFIGCFPRPDLIHIYFAVPLALPLLIYCAKSISQGSLQRYRAATTIVAAVLCIPCVVAYCAIALLALRTETVPTPRGDVAFVAGGAGTEGRDAQALIAQIAASPAEDGYFFYPFLPLMSFLTGREQVSAYDVFTPSYTLPTQYRDACLSVTQHASWVIIDRNLTDPAYLKKILPALKNPEPAETKRFEQVLKAGFKVVGHYGLYDLRYRQPGASQIDCDSIAD
jgi:hypothetical protein